MADKTIVLTDPDTGQEKRAYLNEADVSRLTEDDLDDMFVAAFPKSSQARNVFRFRANRNPIGYAEQKMGGKLTDQQFRSLTGTVDVIPEMGGGIIPGMSVTTRMPSADEIDRRVKPAQVNPGSLQAPQRGFFEDLQVNGLSNLQSYLNPNADSRSRGTFRGDALALPGEVGAGLKAATAPVRAKFAEMGWGYKGDQQQRAKMAADIIREGGGDAGAIGRIAGRGAVENLGVLPVMNAGMAAGGWLGAPLETIPGIGKGLHGLVSLGTGLAAAHGAGPYIKDAVDILNASIFGQDTLLAMKEMEQQDAQNRGATLAGNAASMLPFFGLTNPAKLLPKTYMKQGLTSAEASKAAKAFAGQTVGSAALMTGANTVKNAMVGAPNDPGMIGYDFLQNLALTNPTKLGGKVLSLGSRPIERTRQGVESEIDRIETNRAYDETRDWTISNKNNRFDRLAKGAGIDPGRTKFTSARIGNPLPLASSAKITDYGQSNDPYWDSNSAKGIGAFPHSSKPGSLIKNLSFATSPDIERTLRTAGVRPGDYVEFTTKEGKVVQGRWDDRTSSKLTGRIDFYSPDGPYLLRDRRITSFKSHGNNVPFSIPSSSTRFSGNDQVSKAMQMLDYARLDRQQNDEVSRAPQVWNTPLSEMSSKPTRAERTAHRDAVQKALLDGEDVPDDVLADYPELANQEGTKLPVKAEDKAPEDAPYVMGEGSEFDMRPKNRTVVSSRLKSTVFKRSAMPRRTADVSREADAPTIEGEAPREYSVSEFVVEQPSPTGKTVQLKADGVTYATDRTPVPFVYKIVPMRSLITSHDYNMIENDMYDQSLQNRNRTNDATSIAQTLKIANELFPDFLGESVKASDGAPIIGGDAMVESGNGRTIALRDYVYSRPEFAKQRAEYEDFVRRFAEARGIDMNGIDMPVLVRQRVGDITPEERVRLTKVMNQSGTKSMDASEKAGDDASRLTDDVIMSYKIGKGLGLAENKGFVEHFFRGVPTDELNTVTVRSGKRVYISKAGQARIANAMLAKAIPDTQLIYSIANGETDTYGKSIANALEGVAPDIARLRVDIAQRSKKSGEDAYGDETGTKLSDYDIAGPLATAIRRLASAKTKRDVANSVAEAGSNNLFGGGESTDVVTSKVMEILGDEGYRKSYRRVQDFLENYAILADAASNSPDKKGRLSPLELIVMADSHARNPNDSSMTASAKADVQARLTSARKEWDQVTSDRLAAREAERKAKARESQDTDVPQGRQQTPNEATLPPETGTRSSEENGAIESPRDTSRSEDLDPSNPLENVHTVIGFYDEMAKNDSSFRSKWEKLSVKEKISWAQYIITDGEQGVIPKAMQGVKPGDTSTREVFLGRLSRTGANELRGWLETMQDTPGTEHWGELIKLVNSEKTLTVSLSDADMKTMADFLESDYGPDGLDSFSSALEKRNARIAMIGIAEKLRAALLEKRVAELRASASDDMDAIFNTPTSADVSPKVDPKSGGYVLDSYKGLIHKYGLKKQLNNLAKDGWTSKDSESDILMVAPKKKLSYQIERAPEGGYAEWHIRMNLEGKRSQILPEQYHSVQDAFNATLEEYQLNGRRLDDPKPNPKLDKVPTTKLVDGKTLGQYIVDELKARVPEEQQPFVQYDKFSDYHFKNTEQAERSKTARVKKDKPNLFKTEEDILAQREKDYEIKLTAKEQIEQQVQSEMDKAYRDWLNHEDSVGSVGGKEVFDNLPVSVRDMILRTPNKEKVRTFKAYKDRLEMFGGEEAFNALPSKARSIAMVSDIKNLEIAKNNNYAPKVPAVAKLNVGDSITFTKPKTLKERMVMMEMEDAGYIKQTDAIKLKSGFDNESLFTLDSERPSDFFIPSERMKDAYREKTGKSIFDAPDIEKQLGVKVLKEIPPEYSDMNNFDWFGQPIEGRIPAADVSRADNVKPSTGYERTQSELTENMTVPSDAPSEGIRDSMKAADEAIAGKKTPEQILAELKKQREEAKFKMEQVRKGEC